MSAERTAGGVGSKLRDARQRRGISLRVIADRTKISVGFLEALERNDIARLPGGIFSRSFVRAYAIEVGLDPESTIQEFIAQFPSDSVTAGHPTSVQHDDNEKLESDRRMATTFLKLVGVSLPVAGVVLYFALSGRHQAPPPAEHGVAHAESVAKGTAGRSAADPAAFIVVLAATGRATVSATVDGQHTIEREMVAGDHEEMTVGRAIVLTVSDAGAVSLTLDGAEAKPLGKAGERATLRLTTETFKDDLASQ